MTGAAITASLALAAARPQLSLVAEPARVQLDGPGAATVRVSNRGSAPVVLDVERAGFALDLHGHPRIVAQAPAAWLAVRPRHVVIAAGDAAALRIRARNPPGARPGDHPSLVLLTTRPLSGTAVAIRMRLGIVVVLRVPGRIVHRLRVLAVRGRGRTVTVHLANRGNVAQALTGSRATLTLWRRGRVVARVAARPREILPGAVGVVEFHYRGRLHGAVMGRLGWKPPGPRFRLLL